MSAVDSHAIHNVFVTVGTTCFDRLIETMTSASVLETLSSRGCRQMLLQIGSGQCEPPTGLLHGISVSFYRRRPSISADLTWAQLVVGHCGAGTCMEAVRAGRRMVAVVNDQLMDGHQQQLADKLDQLGCITATSCDQLPHVLQTLDLLSVPPPPPPPCAHQFAELLYQVCEYSN